MHKKGETGSWPGGSYARVPSYSGFGSGGAVSPRSCAAALARGGALLMLACLVSSLISYGFLHGMQQQRAAANAAASAVPSPSAATLAAAGAIPTPASAGEVAAAWPRRAGGAAAAAAATASASTAAAGPAAPSAEAQEGLSAFQLETAAQLQEMQQQLRREQEEAAAAEVAAAAAREAAALASSAAAKPAQQQHKAQQQAAGLKQPPKLREIIEEDYEDDAEAEADQADKMDELGPVSEGDAARPKVAVVNHAAFHFEVVAGWLHVLSQLPVDVIWYQAGQKFPPGKGRNLTAAELIEQQGFNELLGGARYRLVEVDSEPEQVDLALFVSPEYFEAETKRFIERAAPLSTLIMVHNGGHPSVARLAAVAPRGRVIALAPHVASATKNALNIETEWAMATCPYKAKAPCAAGQDPATCRHGFAIQGNFEPHRRNYTRVWSMLLDHQAHGELPTQPPLGPMHLHLLGRGSIDALKLPADAKSYVSVHFSVPYPEYYEQIARANALLLVLGSSSYLTNKMSSSIISSLVTGTPVVADPAVLSAYGFMARDAVHLMQPGEDEVDAALKILRMPADRAEAVRRNLVALAASLNQRTADLITTKWLPSREEIARRRTSPRGYVSGRWH